MPASRSRLRQTTLWPWLQRSHRLVGPRLCAAVHAAVGVLGPRLTPTDLALKHRYDYEILHLDPRLIERSLRVGEWARPQPSAPGRIARFRRWLVLGGGWKNLRRHVSRNVHGRFVASGDWDRRFQLFEIRPTITDMFVEGKPASDTLEYHKMLDWVSRGEFDWTRGCRTYDDVDAYFAELVRLHAGIKRHGYLTQRELGNDGADEIRVCIDRDGRPCVFGGGTHRLSIALLLDLPSVPVLVKRVHREWVQHCCELYGTGDMHEAVARGMSALEDERADAASRRPQRTWA